jgi:hypothetical protein
LFIADEDVLKKKLMRDIETRYSSIVGRQVFEGSAFLMFLV